MCKQRFFKQAVFITVITLIIGLMFVSVTPVIAARGGQGKGRGRGGKPEDRGKPQVIIDNIVGLRRTIPVAWKFPEIPKVSGEGATFEKGDAIYRNFDMSRINRQSLSMQWQ